LDHGEDIAHPRYSPAEPAFLLSTCFRPRWVYVAFRIGIISRRSVHLPMRL
jgi:hypothetical protein